MWEEMPYSVESGKGYKEAVVAHPSHACISPPVIFGVDATLELI